MSLKIELRCILFSLIIVEMFLQLEWNPPVTNSMNRTLFGKAHTCLHKVPLLTVHVRAKTKPWGRRNCPLSSETGLCRETDLGKGTKKCLQHWRFPRTQWLPSFLKCRRLKPPRLFLELVAWLNWAFRGEEPRSGRWPKTRLSLWQSSRVPLWRWENLTEGQPSLQHSTNQAFMVEWPDGSHSSVKGTWQPAWSLQKAIERTLRPWETRFCGLMKPRLNSLTWIPIITSGGNLAPPLRWSMVVAASCCGDVFPWQWLGG